MDVELSPNEPEQRQTVKFLNPQDIESQPVRNDLKPSKPEPDKQNIETTGSLRISFGSEGDGESVNSSVQVRRRSNMIIMTLIIFLGIATCGAFLAVGITSAMQDQRNQFNRHADDLVSRIHKALEDYVTAAAWIHDRCRDRNFTRTDFLQLYEYLIDSGLDFQAAQFDPNITNAERPAAEAEARKYYEANYPSVKYRGFVGFNYANSTTLEPRMEAPFYFPVHYMQPVVGNEPAIDLDFYASGSRKHTVMFCMDNGLPALTDRLVLVQETLARSYGVVLMHPGYNLTVDNGVWPKDIASIVIRIPDLIRRAAVNTGVPSAVYIYDASDSSGLTRFLGASEITVGSQGAVPEVRPLPEVELAKINQIKALHKVKRVHAANKEWIVLVHALEGTYKPSVLFVVLGGVIIFIASACLAYWVSSNSARMDAFNRMRAEAEAERTALILDNARQATKAERELNDFIAHEVGTLRLEPEAYSIATFLTRFFSETNRSATQLPPPCQLVALSKLRLARQNHLSVRKPGPKREKMLRLLIMPYDLLTICCEICWICIVQLTSNSRST